MYTNFHVGVHGDSSHTFETIAAKIAVDKTKFSRLEERNIVLEPEIQLNTLYRVSHELRSLLRESVPYVKLYRYNPKHVYPKLNGYGDNGHRNVWASGVSTYCTPSVTSYLFNAPARRGMVMQSAHGSSDVTR
jgi:hypothetical protein